MSMRAMASVCGVLVLLGAGLFWGCTAGDDGTTTVQRAQMMLAYENPAIQSPVLTLDLGPKTAYPEIQETNFEKRVYVEYLLEWDKPPGPCPPDLVPRVTLDLEGPGLVDKGGLPMTIELREPTRLVFEPTVLYDCAGGPCLTALVAKAVWGNAHRRRGVQVDVEVR